MHFNTESDTEVILWAYKLLGLEECLSRLDGMYAFALYDKPAQKVYLVRDKFGEKPLYYKYDKNKLIFASELNKNFSSDKFLS